jgi:hypothetical protein
MKRIILLTISMCLLLAVSLAWAGKNDLRDEPGYFDFSEFEEFAAEGKSVEVYVKEPLLSFARAALAAEEPELARILDKIKQVTVRVFSIDAKDNRKIRSMVETLDKKLERSDWESTVRVKENGEQVLVYVKTTGNKIDGLAVMAIEYGKEAAFINIIGQIDPVDIGKLSGRFNIPNQLGLVEELSKEEKAAREKAKEMEKEFERERERER